MRPSNIPLWLSSVLGERVVDTVRSIGRPVYRSAVYDIFQPLQNRLRFRRRLNAVPRHDLSGQDVLVVVVDCLRGDHLSGTGYSRDTTPFLDSVGTHYPRCVSAAPWTYPSVPSILSGLYPHNHGAVFDTAERNQGLGNPPATVRKEVYTLPERLAKAGYDTYFMSAIVTAELPIRGRFNKATVEHDARADVLVNGLLEWWDDAAGPRFGYVQLGDLHAPLARPEKMPFGSVPDIQNVDRWDFTTTTEPREEFETYREARIRLYDSNLRFVDEQLRRLFAALSERDELEDTLILITGDHGEEFWERVALERQHFDDPRGVYGTGHGHALIPEVLFVPLVIHGSDLTASEDWTSTVDITPTVLTELGATEQALEGFDGVALQKTPPDNRAVLAEEIAYGYDQQAVVRGEHHLIDSPHEAASVLLDLSTGEPVVDDAVEAELRMLMPTEKHHGETATIDTETQERLADLGYL